MALVFQRTRKAWVRSPLGKNTFFIFFGPNSSIFELFIKVKIAENSKNGLKIVVSYLTLEVELFCCKVQEVLAHPVYLYYALKVLRPGQFKGHF